jgi:PKD repeat protein
MTFRRKNNWTIIAIVSALLIMAWVIPVSAAPMFGSMAPTSGPTTGGTPVTITGTDFVDGALFGVTIGGANANGVYVNPTTITATTPAHAAGTVNVVITNGDGQTDTGTNAFTYIAPAPTFGSIAPTSGPTTGGTPVTITGTNFVSGGSFGVTIGGAAAASVVRVDATHITAVTPAGTAGARNVVITNNDGQTDTGIGAFTYAAAPVAPIAAFTNATPRFGPAPLTVSFTDQSTGSITSHSWNFGDGVTSTAPSPSHQYTAVGTYYVNLTVTGPGGSDFENKSNYIEVGEPAPVAGFSATPTSGPKPLNVQFSDESTGVINTYTWDFGDGGTSNAQNPSHSYTTIGFYTVNLIVIGPGGSDLESKTDYITVGDSPPVAAFSGTPTSGPKPVNVQFTDASTGNITTFAWNFGDGGTSNAQNPFHLYTDVGNYTVILTVTGPGGASTKTEPNYIRIASSATRIGIYNNGVWNLDSTGLEVSDASLSWGLPGDIQVIGDWNGDGKDDIGIFRPSSGIWSLDSNGNFAWEGSDVSLSWGLPNDIPIVGDWNGDNKDSIGIFRPGSGIWSLDSNENFAWEGSDVSLSWGLPNDSPVIGDWNSDNKSDIGIFRPSSGIWSLDLNGNFAWEGSDTSLSWGLPNDMPVIGDWNGDNKSDIGIFRPSSGIWSLDSNGDNTYNSSVKTPKIFRGETGWTPLVGDWNGSGTTKIGVYKTGTLYLDYNGNGVWDSGSDKGYNFGLISDFIPVVGDWNGDGKTKVGFYRWGYWSLDYYGVGTKSKFYTFPYADTYVYSPIVGDWNGDRITEIGAYTYTNGDWCLDYDGNGVWNSGLDRGYNLGGSGWMPVVGDWNGDGKSKIGVFKDGTWRLDYYGNGSLIKVYSFGALGSSPVVGDWNGDRKAKIGVYNPNNGDWNLDYDGNGVWDATADKVNNIGVGTPVVGKWS